MLPCPRRAPAIPVLCSELNPDSLEAVVRQLAPTHPAFDGQALRQMLGLA